ncbi:MAG: protease complex subunit PrcB family protein [Spirochaetales bacterium]
MNETKNGRPLVRFRLVVLAITALLTASCALINTAAGPNEETPGRAHDAPGDADPGSRDAAPSERDRGEDGIAWRELASGAQSAVRTPAARAVGDPAAWADVWAALTANHLEPPDRPDVDFDRETVIVLLLGERPTGGYGVGIEAVIESRGRVEVVVDVRRPQPGDMVTQVLTTPYCVAAIPITGKEITFAGDDLERGFVGD